MPSEDYLYILDIMREMHVSKSHDYAIDSNPFSNFEQAAEYAEVSVQDVFHVLQGIKISRLFALNANKKTPNNESVLDTKLDMIAYQILELAYERYKNRRIASSEVGSAKVCVAPEERIPEASGQAQDGNYEYPRSVRSISKDTQYDLASRITERLSGTYIPNRPDVKQGVINSIAGILEDYL